MRGIAALLAGCGVWIAFTRRATESVTWPRIPDIRVLSVAAAVGLGSFVVALGLLGIPWVAAAVALLAAAAPFSLTESRRSSDRERIADSWQDFLSLLKGRLAGGQSLPEAFADAARSTEGLPAGTAERVERGTRFGEGFASALDELRSELADPTADRVLTTIAVAHTTGGHKVTEVLSALGASVSDELRLRKAHHAALTEQRITALFALIAPWALLALTIATNPQAAAAYRTPGGHVVVGIGLAATGAGFLLARRAARLARTPRLFR